MSFYDICPFGPDRDNWHSAQIASILVNSKRAKGSPSVKLSEFMFVDEQTRRERQTQAFISGLKTVARKKDGIDRSA
jgi:hypothetical protein